MFKNRDHVPLVNDMASNARLPENTLLPPNSHRNTPPVLQLAKKIGNKAMTKLLQNQKESSIPVIQRKLNQDNLNKMKADKPDTYEKDDFENAVGDDGKFTDVKADKGLPTFWGLLREVYGEGNLNQSFFHFTKELGDTCDRPHSVTAEITKNGWNSDRDASALVTAIGNLGYEESLIRDGNDKHRVASYNGGHLVGYQILRGEKADQQWNVAPQDKKNNQQSYNNTIEAMLRGADVGTKYEYTVELQYDQYNFSVDQDQLKKRSILKEIDSDKPWEIQLPVRIPFKWDATALMINDGQFGPPTDGSSSYDQYSQTMDEANLDYTKEDTAARYNLWLADDSGDKKLFDKNSEDFDDIEWVKNIHFSMHQALPTDRKKNKNPINWKGEEGKKVAYFGDVQKGRAAKSANGLGKAEKILEQNKQLIHEIEAIEDVKKPAKFELLPKKEINKNIHGQIKGFFITRLNECQIKSDYQKLRSANEDWLDLFSVRQEELEILQLGKETWNELATKINEQASSVQIEEHIKSLTELKRTLLKIKDHRESRWLYKGVVDATYPEYARKLAECIANSKQDYLRLINLKRIVGELREEEEELDEQIESSKKKVKREEITSRMQAKERMQVLLQQIYELENEIQGLESRQNNYNRVTYEEFLNSK
ncbi:hypothetical protein ABER61_08790 [Brevibacillus formosus]|uniref:Uncharacterized protein n=2 Tax=Brevibacillus formosus TaxID=54913 RepID=A0A837KND4_9BACL|nr:hypothetical protein [Brevibacillus formosus]KLH97749.1 hypothetical protein AA984_17935 [Brevibacillus formosus]PSJ98839.1 hypothetical protein C7R91_05460 [Brevibacillus formosus]GED57560.1 hypothetical protein BFO01nite_16920 [Brevibacillus formosus]